ncbi:heat-shock protein Hsp20 [Amycolatopsis acidiphila]|uniref:Hsp20/alpha crystallin family protein n=2 Tax=Amycolatopsis acidiphila TaxID=715473 RepID=A0A558APD1_9PSEU|nr:Hsp20/alpha crystallin family protein [Amycolatopsis acidiphila]GHG75208.1 heat-shock protein Hsp20 [Amycolatopsis acidiphila]
MALPVLRSSNTVNRWDPFREFEDLHGRLDEWLESAVSGVPVWSPLADVSETADAYLVAVDLPGVKREDVSVELMGTTLAIAGELKEREQAGWFRSRTRRRGRFEYRTTLPHEVDADRVEANLNDGVLSVRIPKSEAMKPRRIEITGN